MRIKAETPEGILANFQEVFHYVKVRRDAPGGIQYRELERCVDTLSRIMNISGYGNFHGERSVKLQISISFNSEVFSSPKPK